MYEQEHLERFERDGRYEGLPMRDWRVVDLSLDRKTEPRTDIINKNLRRVVVSLERNATDIYGADGTLICSFPLLSRYGHDAVSPASASATKT